MISAPSRQGSHQFFYALRCLPHGLTPKNITSIAKELRRGEKKKNVYRHKIRVRKERWKAQVSGKSKLEVADESHHGLILLAHVIDHLSR